MSNNQPIAGHTRALTRTEKEYLLQLRFRTDPDHPTYIFELRRSRWGLIVWTLMCTYEVASQFTKTRATLDALKRGGLIEIGPGQSLPHPFTNGYGHPITLTAAGREATS